TAKRGAGAARYALPWGVTARHLSEADMSWSRHRGRPSVSQLFVGSRTSELVARLDSHCGAACTRVTDRGVGHDSPRARRLPARHLVPQPSCPAPPPRISRNKAI